MSALVRAQDVWHRSRASRHYRNQFPISTATNSEGDLPRSVSGDVATANLQSEPLMSLMLRLGTSYAIAFHATEIVETPGGQHSYGRLLLRRPPTNAGLDCLSDTPP